MSREIRVVKEYPYPPERIWRALTDSKELAQWLMPNDFQPKVGHKFRFDARPQRGWRGYVDCEVLELDEFRRLSYSWEGDANHPVTVVTWTLERIPNGTRLSLRHGDFRGLSGFFDKFFMGSGWNKKLSKILPALLERLTKEDTERGENAPLADSK
jgi:uncharacterized protein YndB with AHSA1/START domain